MTTNNLKVVAWEVRICSEPESEVGVSSKYPEWAERDENLSIMPLVRLSDYERLQDECEKLRKDAERYRFLCDPEGADEDCLAHALNTLNSWTDKIEIDWAIDEAMQDSKE